MTEIETTQNEDPIPSQNTQLPLNNNNFISNDHSDIGTYTESYNNDITTNTINNIEVFHEIDSMKDIPVQKPIINQEEIPNSNQNQFTKSIENTLEVQPFSKPMFENYNPVDLDNLQMFKKRSSLHARLKTSTIKYENAQFKEETAINPENNFDKDQETIEKISENLNSILNKNNLENTDFKSVIKNKQQLLENNSKQHQYYEANKKKDDEFLTRKSDNKKEFKAQIIEAKRQLNGLKTFEKDEEDEEDNKSQKHLNEKSFEDYLNNGVYSLQSNDLIELNPNKVKKVYKKPQDKIFYIVDAENPQSDIHVEEK